jgi:hypothetical protein
MNDSVNNEVNRIEQKGVLESTIASMQHKINILENIIASNPTDHESAIERLNKSHSDEIMALKEFYETAKPTLPINECNNTNDIETLSKLHNEEMIKLKTDYDFKIKELIENNICVFNSEVATHNLVVIGLKNSINQLQNTVNESRVSYQNTMKELNESHNAEIIKYKIANDLSVSVFKNTIDNLHLANKEKISEHDSAQNAHNVIVCGLNHLVQTLQYTLEDLKNTYEYKNNKWTCEYDLLKIEIEELRKSHKIETDRLCDEIEELKKNISLHEDEIVRMCNIIHDMHMIESDRLYDEMEGLENLHIVETDKLRDEIEKSKKLHVIETDEWNCEIEEIINSYRVQLEEMTKTIEDLIKSRDFEIEQRCDEFKENIINSCNVDIAALTHKINESNSRFETMNAQHIVSINVLSNQLKDSQTDHDNMLKQSIADLEKAHDNKLKQTLWDVEKLHDCEMEKSSISYINELKTTIEKYNSITMSMQSELDAFKEETNKLRKSSFIDVNDTREHGTTIYDTFKQVMVKCDEDILQIYVALGMYYESHDIVKACMYFTTCIKYTNVDVYKNTTLYPMILKLIAKKPKLLCNFIETKDTNDDYLNHLLMKTYGKIYNKYELLSKIDICVSCYQSDRLIPLECSHFMCVECYVSISQCDMCHTRVSKSFALGN